MEAKVLMAKILKNFDIRLDMTQNFGVEQALTLRPADGCRCVLTPRN